MCNLVLGKVALMDAASIPASVTHEIDPTAHLAEDGITTDIDCLIPTLFKSVFREAFAKFFGRADHEFVLMRCFDDTKLFILVL